MKSNKRIAGLMAGVLVVGGLVGIALSSGAAQAESASLHLYGQVNNNSLSGNQDLSTGRNVALTVSPTSAGIGSSVEVQVTSSNLNLCNGPAAAAGANAEELDAVIKINGVEYVLRGPQNTVTIDPSAASGASAIAPNCTHTLFNPGWTVSSTAGNSSAQQNGATNSTGTVTNVGVGGATTGIGASVFNRSTGGVGSYAPLAAPTAAGNYTIDLEALALNSLGTSTGLYDSFDEIINLDSTGACAVSSTCAGSAGPGGITSSAYGAGSFYSNVSAYYISAGFASPVVLTSVGPQASVVSAQNLGATGVWTSTTNPTPLTLGAGGTPYVRQFDVLNITGNDQWGTNKSYTGYNVAGAPFGKANTGIYLALCPASATTPFDTAQGCAPPVQWWNKPSSTPGGSNSASGDISVTSGQLSPFSIGLKSVSNVGSYAVWIVACDQQSASAAYWSSGFADATSCLYTGTPTAGYGPTQKVKLPIQLLGTRTISTTSTIVSSGGAFVATGSNWYPGETVSVKGGTPGAAISGLAITNTNVSCSQGTATVTAATSVSGVGILTAGNYYNISGSTNQSGAFNNSNAKLATVTGTNQLSLTKTANSSPATTGGTYTLSFSVNGTALTIGPLAYNTNSTDLATAINTALTNNAVSGVTASVSGSVATSNRAITLAGASSVTAITSPAVTSGYTPSAVVISLTQGVNAVTYVQGSYVCGADTTNVLGAADTGSFKNTPGTASSSDTPVSLTASSTGTLGGPVTITDGNDTELYATGIQSNQGSTNPSPVQNYAEGGSFSVSKDSCVVGVGTCVTQQTVNITIAGGTLSQQAATNSTTNGQGVANPSNTIVNFGSLTSAVTPGTATAFLNSITVTDARGGTTGWSLTATATNFADSTKTINKSNLAITPTCAASGAQSANAAPGTTTSAAGTSFSGTVNLCTKDTQVATTSQSTGGVYTVTAPLTLTVPAFQIVGTYSSTVTVTLA